MWTSGSEAAYRTLGDQRVLVRAGSPSRGGDVVGSPSRGGDTFTWWGYLHVVGIPSRGGDVVGSPSRGGDVAAHLHVVGMLLVHLHVVGMLRFTFWAETDRACALPFHSVLVSVSVFMALRTVVYIPSILPTTPSFLTLFVRSYFCLIGPVSYISL